ncbi:YegP family protein [Pedobacter jeongneungensis]|uniref:YegP family protein n=1 Tax=Pedobacter jeongneungensis TaxID=947309 RepID=UPI000A022AE8|nr:YegP family protein [Pedobacter jeongneungensis]
MCKDAVGNYTFNLKAANGEIIGRSENYTTAANRENGIDAIKRNAPNASLKISLKKKAV